MIRNLPQFLFRKKTLAVVGVLIVLMVGFGIKLRSYSEWKRERIELAERLMAEPRRYRTTYKFIHAKVTQQGDNKFTVDGNAVTRIWFRNRQEEMTYTGIQTGTPPSGTYRIWVTIEKTDYDRNRTKRGEWGFGGIGYSSELLDSPWDRIKKYVFSYLP